jgi:hypothetical protein
MSPRLFALFRYVRIKNCRDWVYIVLPSMQGGLQPELKLDRGHSGYFLQPPRDLVGDGTFARKKTGNL